MISFKLFAGTNIGLRDNNEDNFAVCPDLSKNEWIVPADNQQVIQLGPRGSVMVVADGMGGQNAGEVASAIAIATVQEMFSPNQISSDVFNQPDTIKSFLKKVISECDIRIKRRAEEDSLTVGMGSTIVMSWLIGSKLYIAWLGDSRAYSFNKGKGIVRLSKDHSYVQQLVDAGAITDEEAMDHPNSNVITRSLGDTSQKAKPDVIEYDVEDGQIILLCSDGLCGVCRDEEIGGIIEAEEKNLQVCKEKLTTAALAAGGSDNITISLMHISIDKTHPANSEGEKAKSNKLDLATITTSMFGLFLLFVLLYASMSLFSKKPLPAPSIKVWLDSDTLAAKEKTFYHVIVVGDTMSTLYYDKSLIDVNVNDSSIKVKTKISTLKGDTAIFIKVTCKHNVSLVDSVQLVIKQSWNFPTEERNISKEKDIKQGGGNGTQNDGSSKKTSDTGSITPSSVEGPDKLIKDTTKKSIIKQ